MEKFRPLPLESTDGPLAKLGPFRASATDGARLFGRGQVDTGVLLFAVLQTQGAASNILRTHAIRLEDVKSHLQPRASSRTTSEVSSAVTIREKAQEVLDRAMKIANHLGSQEPYDLDLLEALLEKTEGIVHDIIRELGGNRILLLSQIEHIRTHRYAPRDTFPTNH